MVLILMIPAKLATPGRPNMKIFREKVYEVIILYYDVTNKIIKPEFIKPQGYQTWIS